MKPEITLKSLSKIINLTDRRIQQLAKKGIIPKANHGKYDLVDSINGYVCYLQDLVQTKDLEGVKTNTKEDKARKLHHEANIRQIEEQKAKRELELLDALLINRDDALMIWSEAFINIKKTLRSLPKKIASEVVGKDSEVEIEDKIKNYIDLSLEDLSDMDL
jgi:phage terminase Nu1 subunit (DNA packaging protein)